MKNRWLLIVACGIGLSTQSNAQDVCVKANRILEKINKLHIQARTVNDSLSADIFSEFFQTLDPYGDFFIAKDTGSLVRYRNKLDDGNEPVCSFVRDAGTLYRKKLEWYRKLTDSTLAKPFDVSKKETGPTAVQNQRSFCKTNSELKNRAIQELKLKTLLGIYRHAAADSAILSNADAFIKAEPAARQRIRKNELVKIEQLLKDQKLLNREVESAYLKAIPAVFDPHSTFFSEEEMNAYNEDLNPNALSFGIRVDESATGEVKVSKVVPGSPAWNSNQVNKDDVLIGILWKPSGEYVDLVDLDAAVIETTLDEAGKTSAEITIRKPTGELRNVKLVKEKLENEENIVSGFVLKGGASKRTIGYISLPGFFTDINPELSGCAVAVTKEIIKLKGESIEGLILDLRYNGGGSLFEAIELAGLFIDGGPIGVVETTGEAPAVIKDMNRGLVYDGPLVIMVNGASASASEVVAAALQDYRRAVVVGSTTYGKATGQTVVAVDDNDKSQGFLKVTEMRLYRINGQSHQVKGVVPDFPLRDLSSVFYQREEQEAHALKPRTTNKKTYYTQWADLYSKAAKYTVDNRSKTSDVDAINELEKILGAGIPLERQGFIAFMKNLQEVSKKASAGNGAAGAYTVSNSKYDASVLELDLYHREMNKEILQQVKSSVYIQEVYKLLDNIIEKKE